MPAMEATPELPGGERSSLNAPTMVTGWGRLLPGDVVIAALAAGAVAELRGAGEHAEVTATRQVWIRATAPTNAS
eukprot:11175297-Lingulodinium_polyedra.AAC.1